MKSSFLQWKRTEIFWCLGPNCTRFSHYFCNSRSPGIIKTKNEPAWAQLPHSKSFLLGKCTTEHSLSRGDRWQNPQILMSETACGSYVWVTTHHQNDCICFLTLLQIPMEANTHFSTPFAKIRHCQMENELPKPQTQTAKDKSSPFWNETSNLQRYGGSSLKGKKKTNHQ